MTDLAVAVTVTDSAGLKATAGSTITITAGTTTSVKIGETNILANFDNGNANLLCTQPITLTQPSALQSLSFWVGTVGGQLRLGLYSGASAPNNLVTQTAAFTPVAGWNTQPATSPMVPSGQYWLCYFPQSNTLAFRKADTGGTSYLKTLAFGPLPATFPAGTSTTPSHWSFYGTFGVTPDTTPPSIPTNLTAKIS